MWGGMTGAPPHAMGMMYGGVAAQQPQQQQQQQQQKHDIFVGNLAFNTTEEQLHQAFSEIGRVVKVRLVTDAETGKPRGFAFVEFEDPQAALSAIRNMNEYELNGRRLRVNFSNSSHLEALAGKLGMDLSQNQNQSNQISSNKNQGHHHHRGGGGAGGDSSQQSGGAGGASGGTQAVADALKSMSKGEMYDVVAKFKEIADRDPDEARRLISGHPQLPEAILFLMSKLDMVKTPISTDSAAAIIPGVTPKVDAAAQPKRAMDPRARPTDPRAAAAAATPAAPAPPEAQPAIPPRIDPRQAARMDPRRVAQQQQPPMMAQQPGMPPQQLQQQQGLAPQQLQQQQYAQQQQQYQAQQQQPPPPPPMQQQQQQPPPPMQPQQQPGIANLDPALVQQVMSLTPQQISQLPPDKQQSILALRQQIAGSGM